MNPHNYAEVVVKGVGPFTIRFPPPFSCTRWPLFPGSAAAITQLATRKGFPGNGLHLRQQQQEGPHMEENGPFNVFYGRNGKKSNNGCSSRRRGNWEQQQLWYPVQSARESIKVRPPATQMPQINVFVLAKPLCSKCSLRNLVVVVILCSSSSSLTRVGRRCCCCCEQTRSEVRRKHYLEIEEDVCSTMRFDKGKRRRRRRQKWR